MSAPTGAKKRGVYEFIWELIREGHDVHLVNHKGLFDLNWPVVARRYFDHQAAKNPKKAKQFDPKSASNGLRAALLNFYKKEGAYEIKQARKFGDNNEVVWRQFQMPHRIYCELMESSGQTQREETSSDESMFEEVMETSAASSPQSAACVDDSAGHTSTDSSGFFETTDIAGTPESDIAAAHSRLCNPNHSNGSDIEPLCPEDECEPCDLLSSLSEMSEAEFQLALSDVTSSEIEALDLESKEKNLVSEIFPCRDSTKGGSRFSVTLAEPLPPTVSSIVAYFGEIGPVDLEKKNEFTVCGTVPSAPKAGTVVVGILTDGKYIGDAEFEYVNPVDECMKLLVQNPMYLDLWAVQQLGTQLRWLDVTEVLKLAHPANGQPDNSPASHTQLVKSVDVLQLMVYTAAKIDAQQFMRVLFSTSVGRVVFNQYRDKATLPHDVARANGHEELAQYLEEVHQKLQETDDQVDEINWQELRHAVKTSWETTGSLIPPKEQEVDELPSCSDHGTDYDADGESSSSFLSDASSTAEMTCHDLQPNASCSVDKTDQPPGVIRRNVDAEKDVLESMTSSHCEMTCADSKSESPAVQCRSPPGKEGWEDVQCTADQCSGPNAKRPASFMHERRGENKEQDSHRSGQMKAPGSIPIPCGSVNRGKSASFFAPFPFWDLLLDIVIIFCIVCAVALTFVPMHTWQPISPFERYHIVGIKGWEADQNFKWNRYGAILSSKMTGPPWEIHSAANGICSQLDSIGVSDVYFAGYSNDIPVSGTHLKERKVVTLQYKFPDTSAMASKGCLRAQNQKLTRSIFIRTHRFGCCGELVNLNQVITTKPYKTTSIAHPYTRAAAEGAKMIWMNEPNQYVIPMWHEKFAFWLSLVGINLTSQSEGAGSNTSTELHACQIHVHPATGLCFHRCMNGLPTAGPQVSKSLVRQKQREGVIIKARMLTTLLSEAVLNSRNDGKAKCGASLHPAGAMDKFISRCVTRRCIFQNKKRNIVGTKWKMHKDSLSNVTKGTFQEQHWHSP